VLDSSVSALLLLHSLCLAGQREDGGWPPPWTHEYSSLDATCFRLAQGEGLGIGFLEPAFAHAAAFLRARQRQDGSWEEDEALAAVTPSWVKPVQTATHT
jgi:hypothetical protein